MPLILSLNHFAGLILLAPVLLIQGRWVRQVTPLLPEPEGSREGSKGEGRALSLLILGDSAAAGVGAQHQDRALSGLLCDSLSQDHALHWKLLACTGDASSDLIQKLEREPARTFQFVLISVGVNDVTGLTSGKAWLANLKRIESLLVDKFEAEAIVLTSIPPMHLFPALPNPLRWWLGNRARLLNHLMRTHAHREGSRCIYMPVPFEPDLSLMASDGFHPGPEACKVWSQAASDLIRKLIADLS